MRARKEWGGSLLLALGVLVTSSAQAQSLPVEATATSEPEESGQAAKPEHTAMEWGHEGLKLYSEERWSDAGAAFQEAEAKAHSPVFLLYAARSYEKDGQELKALELYRLCARQELSEDSPSPWVDAVESSGPELLELERRLSSATLTFSGEWSQSLQMRLPKGERAIDSSRLVLSAVPGAHTLLAKDAKGHLVTQIWQARPGEHNIHIDFRALEPNTMIQAMKSSPKSESEVPPAALSPMRKGALAAFAISGVSLVGGTVAGAAALSLSHRLKKRCVDSVCQAEDEHLKYAAQRSARLSRTGLILAGVGGTLGLTLWLLPDKGGEPQVHAEIGSDGFRFRGRF